uniref:Uncharacterized protein n=1 Tax=Cacopsylla melanoneura TaxID=428564 RepID=A0A8D8QWK2_9HEMI
MITLRTKSPRRRNPRRQNKRAGPSRLPPVMERREERRKRRKRRRITRVTSLLMMRVIKRKCPDRVRNPSHPNARRVLPERRNPRRNLQRKTILSRRSPASLIRSPRSTLVSSPLPNLTPVNQHRPPTRNSPSLTTTVLPLHKVPRKRNNKASTFLVQAGMGNRKKSEIGIREVDRIHGVENIAIRVLREALPPS